MPHLPRPSKAVEAIRPLLITAACIMLVTLATACGVVPTATPIPPSTPLPTAVPATTIPEAPASATPAPSDTPTEAATATATISPTATSTPSPIPTEPPLAYTWKQAGLAKEYLRDIALFPGGNNIVLVAASDGLWKSSYDYTNWQKLSAPVSGNPPPGNAKLAIASPDAFYLARHTGCASGLPLTSYHSTDAGQTWSTMSAGLTAVHAPNATTAYGTTCKGVVKSTDSGATWSTELAGSNFENADPYAVTSTPDGETVFAAYASEGGAGHIKRSTDGGANWADITPQGAPDGQLQPTPGLQFVAGTEGRPQDGGLYMANSQGVWFLPAESSEWQFRPSSPEGQPTPSYFVSAFFVDTAYSADYDKPGPVMYEARSLFNNSGPAGLGVFRSVNLGGSWQQVGDDLGKRLITGVVVAPHDSSATPGMVETLLATTEDGVWSVPMPPPFK